MDGVSRNTFLLVVDDISARLQIERVEVIRRVREACDRSRAFYARLREQRDEWSRAAMAAKHEMEHS